MSGLLKLLRDDVEIQELKEQCHEITGKWIPYHWDCFNGIEAYKEHMRKIVREHELSQKQK